MLLPAHRNVRNDMMEHLYLRFTVLKIDGLLLRYGVVCYSDLNPGSYFKRQHN